MSLSLASYLFTVLQLGSEWLGLQRQRKCLEAELVRVSRQMNSFIHLCCFPSELLVEIFACIGAYQPGQRTSDSILGASHVCYHWKEIILQFPRLRFHLELGCKPEYHYTVL